MKISFPDQKLIDRAAKNDEYALLTLDKRGLLAGKSESLEDYCERITKLRQQYIDFEEQCKKENKGKFEGFSYECDKDGRIAEYLYAKYAKTTDDLFGFSIDWVPGFYSPMGPLFGGCAVVTPPNAFTLFFLRPGFAKRDKWFLYTRRELMSHELSHVARAALEAIKYEEFLAYKTAESLFRRRAGSLLRTQGETMLLMALMLGLIGVQAWLFFTQPEAWQEAKLFLPMPVMILMALFLCVITGFSLRQWLQHRRFNALLKRLETHCPQAMHFLFRLDDEEIDLLCQLKDCSASSVENALKTKCQGFRLKLVMRFFQPAALDNP